MTPRNRILCACSGALLLLVLGSSTAWAGLARIMSIRGSVQLQREGWREFQPAYPGTALYGPDLLQPSRGSRVLVICPNGSTRWIVPAGTISAVNNGCPGTPSALKPQFGVGDLRGGSDPAVPYVIAPRRDSVLNPTPRLSWNPVEGAESYTAALQARGETLWRFETEQTEIPYPDSEPELAPRKLYTLVVTANTGSASTDEAVELRFNLLGGDQAGEAQAEIDAIRALDLPELLKTLILVEEIYPNYRLTAVAIADLTNLIDQGVETAQVYRLLGDVYLKSGLRLLAEASYGQAIGLAIPSGELEEQVLAQLGLGELYSQVDEPEKAIRQFQCAQAGATELGDESLISSIEEKLAGLK
ncbi:MAG: tetratricopeptide repeat protein [Leptolyngbyaceae cyanobacterium MO_188.B28]|nr:tetratricopeptide repeat protein [Leptolyngbyaceae cyanobacterium MO_188.B28]